MKLTARNYSHDQEINGRLDFLNFFAQNSTFQI